MIWVKRDRESNKPTTETFCMTPTDKKCSLSPLLTARSARAVFVFVLTSADILMSVESKCTFSFHEHLHES